MVNKIDGIGLTLSMAKELYLHEMKHDGIRPISKEEEEKRHYSEEFRIEMIAEKTIKEAEVFVRTFFKIKGEYEGI